MQMNHGKSKRKANFAAMAEVARDALDVTYESPTQIIMRQLAVSTAEARERLASQMLQCGMMPGQWAIVTTLEQDGNMIRTVSTPVRLDQCDK
jgi:hypothetical protein